jgi:hypothetical protein
MSTELKMVNAPSKKGSVNLLFHSSKNSMLFEWSSRENPKLLPKAWGALNTYTNT